MMHWFAHHLTASGLEKITPRAGLAAAVAFLLAVVFGQRTIRWLAARFREPNASPSPVVRQLHRSKLATPTMGGLFIVAAILAVVLTLGDLTNRFVQAAIALTLGLTAIGVADDLSKLRGGKGLAARSKLLSQVAVCLPVVIGLYRHLDGPGGIALHVPFLGTSLPLGIGFVPLALLVVVGASNAVNLADGLDGLAGGCLVFSVAATGLLAYIAGHAQWAAYLGVPRSPGAGEMAVLAGGILGAVLGFLWFNCHPAQVFMGDTGSLPLGGLLGLMALAARQELLLALVAGVFVAEAASVVVQVVVFRATGRRVFSCAPLHHHFQFAGWPESRVVVRFWIASALCGLAALGTLKLPLAAADARPAAVAAVETMRR